MLNSPLTKTYTPSLAEKMPFKEARKEYEEIGRILTGYVVDLGEVDKIYHRTTPENARQILKSGQLLARPPGDLDQLENIGTDRVSLSVNPSNTYGGAVRLVWDIDQLNVGLEPVLYPYRVNVGSRHGVEELYREKHYPEMENRNNLRALMEISPEMYKEEAEVMATGNITAPPEAVELWLARKVSGFNVSCEGESGTALYWKMSYADGWKYFRNFGNQYQKLNDVSNKARGEDLTLRSCWKLVNFGGKYPDVIMETTKDNLEYFQELLDQFWGTRGYLKEGAKEIREQISEITDIEEEPSPPPPKEREGALSEFQCRC